MIAAYSDLPLILIFLSYPMPPILFLLYKFIQIYHCYAFSNCSYPNFSFQSSAPPGLMASTFAPFVRSGRISHLRPSGNITQGNRGLTPQHLSFWVTKEQEGRGGEESRFLGGSIISSMMRTIWIRMINADEDLVPVNPYKEFPNAANTPRLWDSPTI